MRGLAMGRGPYAGPGYGNRVIGHVDQLRKTSFFPILILVDTKLVLAVHQLMFAEI